MRRRAGQGRGPVRHRDAARTAGRGDARRLRLRADLRHCRRRSRRRPIRWRAPAGRSVLSSRPSVPVRAATPSGSAKPRRSFACRASTFAPRVCWLRAARWLQRISRSSPDRSTGWRCDRVPALAELLGARLMRGLAAGEPIVSDAVALPPVVRSGDEVRLTVRAGWRRGDRHGRRGTVRQHRSNHSCGQREQSPRSSRAGDGSRGSRGSEMNANSRNPSAGWCGACSRVCGQRHGSDEDEGEDGRRRPTTTTRCTRDYLPQARTPRARAGSVRLDERPRRAIPARGASTISSPSASKRASPRRAPPTRRRRRRPTPAIRLRACSGRHQVSAVGDRSDALWRTPSPTTASRAAARRLAPAR